jgi:hypothetical protein
MPSIAAEEPLESQGTPIRGRFLDVMMQSGFVSASPAGDDESRCRDRDAIACLREMTVKTEHGSRLAGKTL